MCGSRVRIALGVPNIVQNLFATDRSEPMPDAIIYGLNLEDALKRYVSKHHWTASNMRYSRVNSKTFAKFVALPNHGMHRAACPWSLNLPKNIKKTNYCQNLVLLAAP